MPLHEYSPVALCGTDILKARLRLSVPLDRFREHRERTDEEPALPVERAVDDKMFARFAVRRDAQRNARTFCRLPPSLRGGRALRPSARDVHGNGRAGRKVAAAL